MASLLERSMYPQMDSGGLTSGVDYFGSVGRGRNAALNLNRGPQTIASAETEVPQGTGFVPAPAETGFGGGGGESSGGMGDTGGQNAPFGRDQANTASFIGQGMQLLGGATQTPALGIAGGFLGAGAAASQGDFLPMGQLGLGLAGQSELAGNLGLVARGARAYGQYNDDSVNNAGVTAGLRAGAYDTAINANPMGRLANFGTTAATYFGGDMPTSLGQTIEFAPRGYQTFGNVGPIDAAQGQMVVERSQDPLGAYLAVQGQVMSQNQEAMQAAAYARAVAFNTDPLTEMGNMRSDAGSYGLPPPVVATPEPVASSGGGGYNSSAGLTNAGLSRGTPAPAANIQGTQLADFESSGGGGGGGDFGFADGFGGMDGFAGNTTEGSDFGGGYGGTSFAADGGLATSNGFMRPMPGITQKYMNGGPVQGGPMLSMGYADGGMMGQMGGKPTSSNVSRQVDAMLRDPRARQALLARPQQLMASGELTPDEVTTMGRVAEAALFSPELYPQLRQFVAAQGMNPLPATFDPTVIMRIMAIARGLQQETPAGQVPGMDQAQMRSPVPGEENGGYLQGPGSGRSDSIGTINDSTGSPVKVSNGEYVIPEHVVRAKGREFFDNLLRRYSDVPKGE